MENSGRASLKSTLVKRISCIWQSQFTSQWTQIQEKWIHYNGIIFQVHQLHLWAQRQTLSIQLIYNLSDINRFSKEMKEILSDRVINVYWVHHPEHLEHTYWWNQWFIITESPTWSWFCIFKIILRIIAHSHSSGWIWRLEVDINTALHLHSGQMIPCSMVQNSPHYKTNETINTICFQEVLGCCQALKHSTKKQKCNGPTVEAVQKHWNLVMTIL